MYMTTYVDYLVRLDEEVGHRLKIWLRLYFSVVAWSRQQLGGSHGDDVAFFMGEEMGRWRNSVHLKIILVLELYL